MSIGIVGNGRRRRALIATVVGLALVAAACGDDDDGGSAATTAAASATTAGASATTAGEATKRRRPGGTRPPRPPRARRRRPPARRCRASRSSCRSSAYSVAKAANDAAEEAFAETPARQGRHVDAVLRRVGRPEPGRRRRPRRPTYVHFSLSPDVTRLVDAGLVAKDWDQGTEQGHRHQLGRRHRRPQGQPEGHQGLGRPRSSPASSIVTPNPGSSGSARWNILAGLRAA